MESQEGNSTSPAASLDLFSSYTSQNTFQRAKRVADGDSLLLTDGEGFMELRAFVIDDNEMIRSLVSSIMELRGYEVLPYSEPLFCPIYLNRECACPQEHPCGDIFITDKSMPYMTGLDLVENQGRNGCKGILKNKAVMSGAWTDAEIEQARKLGCQIFEKPFRIKEINKWLDECEKRIYPDRKLADLRRQSQKTP